MSEHSPLLDSALWFAQHAGADLAEAFDYLNQAATQTDDVDRWMDGAVRAIATTNELIEKHMASYDSGQEIADQAVQLHSGQEYGQNNSPARRAGILLLRGRQLIDDEKGSLLAMSQSLLNAHGRLTETRRSVIEAMGLLQKAATACGPLAVMQDSLTQGIQKYINDRDIETRVLRNVQGSIEYGDEKAQQVKHTKQPIEVAENIATAMASLTGRRQTLQAVETALGEIPGILQELDHAMAFWFGAGGMPPELYGIQSELVQLAHQLHLPITLEVLDDHVRRLELQRKGFEASQGALEESKRWFIPNAREYITTAISAIVRYLGRGF
jgi:predicted hotdog family 3-hydroxylacyl-ACP dehydratase